MAEIRTNIKDKDGKHNPTAENRRLIEFINIYYNKIDITKEYRLGTEKEVKQSRNDWGCINLKQI